MAMRNLLGECCMSVANILCEKDTFHDYLNPLEITYAAVHELPLVSDLLQILRES